jgi:hypothetical protein
MVAERAEMMAEKNDTYDGAVCVLYKFLSSVFIIFFICVHVRTRRAPFAPYTAAKPLHQGKWN